GRDLGPDRVGGIIGKGHHGRCVGVETGDGEGDVRLLVRANGRAREGEVQVRARVGRGVEGQVGAGARRVAGRVGGGDGYGDRSIVQSGEIGRVGSVGRDVDGRAVAGAVEELHDRHRVRVQAGDGEAQRAAIR